MILMFLIIGVLIVAAGPAALITVMLPRYRSDENVMITATLLSLLGVILGGVLIIVSSVHIIDEPAPGQPVCLSWVQQRPDDPNNSNQLCEKWWTPGSRK